MKHLGLPHPKQMDVAVPANLKCGKPQAATQNPKPQRHAWACRATMTGRRSPTPSPASGRCSRNWLEEHLRDVQVSTCASSTNSTARSAMSPARSWSRSARLPTAPACSQREKPIVVVCRSGARSAQATLMLGKAGFEKVANLSGGMLRWRTQRFPVEGGSD